MEPNAHLPEAFQGPQKQTVDTREIDPLKLWLIIWRRRWSILFFMIVVSMITALWVNTLTPVYRAWTSILIRENTAPVSIEQIFQMQSFSQEKFETQMNLLRSRSLMERVATELDLVKYFGTDQGDQAEASFFSIQRLLKFFGLGSLLPSSHLESAPKDEDLHRQAIALDKAVQILQDSITIERIEKSSLVVLSVDSVDPVLAADLANAVTRGYIESQFEVSLTFSNALTATMEGRVDELRDRLIASEKRLHEYREAENLVDLDGVSTITGAELTGTGERLLDARRQRAEAESQYRQVQAIRGDWQRLSSVPAVLSDSLMQSFKAEEARARARVEELSRRYGAKHPAMEAARSDLSAASASLRAQVEQVVAGIERNYQLAVANENSIESSFDKNKDQIKEITRKKIKLDQLEREVEANRGLYEIFLSRLKETAATAGVDVEAGRVVDPAVIPQSYIFPNKVLFIFIAAFLALLIGVGVTLLLEVLSDTFKGFEDVENILDLPVFGLLPMLKNKTRDEVMRAFLDDQDKSFSESLRTVRTGVVISSVGVDSKVVLISSSVPGEGKSTVAVNLALALGQLERVLLIDGDLRRPSIARVFSFPAGSPGLANCLAHTAKVIDCIKKADNIDILPAGTVPPNPLELLSSPSFAELMAELRGRYDRIVIDTPPTHAVSDPLILSSHVDSVIYVIKYDATHIPLVKRGVGKLLQSNAPIKGVVLNHVDLEKAKKFGHDDYYGYYDYYEYTNDSDSLEKKKTNIKKHK